MDYEVIEVTYYYRLKEETIESSITKTANKAKITKEDEEVTYTINYNAKITNYNGKAKITVVDYLPAGIDQSKSNLAGGTYNEGNKTITWEETVNVNGSITKTINKTITLVYEGQDVTKDLENTVKGTVITYYPDNYPDKSGEEKTIETKEDEATVRQEYKVNKVVEKVWQDNNNEKEKRPEAINVRLLADGKDAGKVVLSDTNNWKHEFKNLNKYDSKGKEIEYTAEESEVKTGDLKDYKEAIITEKADGTIVVTNPLKEVEPEKTGKVITKYLEKGTNRKLRDEKVTEDKVGENYSTQKETITGYKFVESTDNTKGKYIDGTITVIYYYEKEAEPEEKMGTVITKYLEKGTNKKLLDEVTTKDKVGASYSTKKETIDSYKFVESTNNTKGKYIDGTITVIYYYEKIVEEKEKAKVIVRYLEVETEKELLPEDTIEGKVEDQYVTSRKVVETYRKAEPEPNNKSGKMTKETIVVTYYYERIPGGKVIAEYLDIDTEEEIEKSEITEDYVGEEYKTEEKYIKYYELVESKLPENKEGIYTEEDQLVTYYYKQLPFNLRVEKAITEIIKDGDKMKITDEKLMKTEVVGSKIAETSIIVRYKILVTNASKIEGTADVVENIPQDFEVAGTTLSTWELMETGKLKTKVSLKPGETKELEVILKWNNETFGTKKNKAELTNIQNPAGFEETNKLDNSSAAEVILAIKTGGKVNGWMLCTSICLFAAAMLLIPAYKIEIRQKKE